ncbi:hypothetical protein [Streptosporangium vulgare]|uniref:Methyltransferase n=1 Tax=Streptosporangium vulgare TaxID=46190 RepID=A0ABV5TQ20_9ACTN
MSLLGTEAYRSETGLPPLVARAVEAAADPGRLLTPGGVLVVDDFTPSATWPPEHLGRPDSARVHWLEHPALRAVDLPLSGDLSTVVGVRRP